MRPNAVWVNRQIRQAVWKHEEREIKLRSRERENQANENSLFDPSEVDPGYADCLVDLSRS